MYVLRTAFLPKTANDCFFFFHEACVHAKITALICLKINARHVQKYLAAVHSLQQSIFKKLKI